METLVIIGIVHLKWRFKNDHNICITSDKKVINRKTYRVKKCCVNGGYSDGYWIGKKFIPIEKINDYVELIPKDNCLF